MGKERYFVYGGLGGMRSVMVCVVDESTESGVGREMLR